MITFEQIATLLDSAEDMSAVKETADDLMKRFMAHIINRNLSNHDVDTVVTLFILATGGDEKYAN